MNSVMRSNSNGQSVVEEAYDWHLRFLETDVTAEERRAFEEWLSRSSAHEAAYRKAQGFVAALDKLSQSDFDEDVHRKLLSERFRCWWDDRFRGPSNWSTWALSGSTLAALAVVIIFFRIDSVADLAEPLAPIVSTYSSAVGVTRSVALDDGSMVTLGAATTLRITFEPGSRQARLDSGDAFFKVKPDASRPFMVRSGDLTVEVLGTTFDVRNNGGVIRVAVSEGSVEVRHPMILADRETGFIQAEELIAGQQIAASKGSLGDVSNIDPTTIGAWRRSRLEYRRAPLSEVVADVNRYSSVPISVNDPVDELGSLTVSGIFDAARPALILERLPKVLPVTLDHSDPSRIVIRPLPPIEPN